MRWGSGGGGECLYYKKQLTSSSIYITFSYELSH